MACDQAGLDGYSGGRTSYDACVVLAVAAVVAAQQSLMAVADFGGGRATSMDSVANEHGRRKVRHRPQKVKEGERGGGSCDAEA